MLRAALKCFYTDHGMFMFRLAAKNFVGFKDSGQNGGGREECQVRGLIHTFGA